MPGYVSHFLWGLNTAKEVELGELYFSAGASLVGRVINQDNCGAASPPALIRLIPILSGDSGETQRILNQFPSVRSQGNGLFQFEDLDAGTYKVFATREGCAPAQMSPVTIHPMIETTLRGPLILTQPGELEIAVDPPLDPHGQRWRIELLHVTTLSGAP